MQKLFTCGFTSEGKEFVKCMAVSDRGTVYTGKAICSPNDEFSLKLGMDLAEARATYKQIEKIRKAQVARRDLAHSLYLKTQRDLGKITHLAVLADMRISEFETDTFGL